MPLLDHFHPPLSDRRPWESFHTTWASAIADQLNAGMLPEGYIALEHVHEGAALEIDVATVTDREAAADASGGTTTAARVWTPAAAPVIIPASFPPECKIEIVSSEGGRQLVAAIELVSPANKDREGRRKLFAAKCATLLARGVGLVTVDVVTSRAGNLHNDLAVLLGLDARLQMPAASSLYAVGYRPLVRDGREEIDTWPVTLAVGQPLPTLPLSLAADLCLPLDLEESYREACRRRRIDEVTP
jgi:hypothetical protein